MLVKLGEHFLWSQVLPTCFLFFIFGESRAVLPSPSNSKLVKVALPVALHAAERRDGEAGFRNHGIALALHSFLGKNKTDFNNLLT